MKEMDCVEITVEKEEYTSEGVHMGMQGWICYEKCVKGYSLVEFSFYGEAGIIATIDVLDDDMIVIPDWNAHINEAIKAAHKE